MAAAGDLKDWLYSDQREIRAVGITAEGVLIGIKDLEDIRGLKFTGLVVSIKHRVWFKENEKHLRNLFSMQDGHGQIAVFGGTGSFAEVF